jgi:polyisoprenoid-binding protein YceI
MIRISWLLVSYLAAAIVILAGPDQPEQAIDTEHSFLTVHVGKAGLLSAAAHEHWINAPIAGGTIAADGSTPAVRFTVDARRLSVRPEKGVPDKDRAEVQSNMQSKVLESNIYPDIVFRSTEVRRTGALVWGVSGDLTLHGVTKPVSVDVTRQNDAYVGTVRIKQTEFGIQPIKIGGGVVRVKDELEISFRVYTASR